jgi:hypothetical protein
MEWNELLRLGLLERLWLWLPLAGVVVLVAGHLIARWQIRRRCAALLRAFNDSTGSQVRLLQGPHFEGFRAQLQPPPEPFMLLTLSHRAAWPWDLLGRLLRPATQGWERLVIQASLDERPQQELAWVRGQIPGVALGKTPNTITWTLHQLDFVGVEYATRGPNPGALIHVFTALQTRFDPLLERVTVRREEQPHITVALRSRRLNADQLPALVALVRAAGRAARLA